MNAEYKMALKDCGTDIDGALQRLSDDEDLYELCLFMFLKDQAMDKFNKAVENSDWDDALVAIYALKGAAGTMGLTPLYHAAEELLLLIQAGRFGEVSDSRRRLRNCYEEITAVIRQHS